MPLWKAGMYKYHRNLLDTKSRHGKLYQVFMGQDGNFSPHKYINFFKSMHNLYNTKNKWYQFWDKQNHDWMTLELWGTHSGIRTYTWTSEGVPRELIEANISSIHKDAEIANVRDKYSALVKRIEKVKDKDTEKQLQKQAELFEDYARFGKLADKHMACATLTLEEYWLKNLVQTSGKTEFNLIDNLCRTMQNLEDKDEMGIQFVLRPVVIGNQAKSIYEEYTKTGKMPAKWLRYPATKSLPYFHTTAQALRWIQRNLESNDDKKKPDKPMFSNSSIQGKAGETVYFDIMVRIFATGQNAQQNLNTALSNFSPTEDRNKLATYKKYQNIEWEWCKVLGIGQNKDQFIHEYSQRRVPTYPIFNYITPPELTTLAHFPSNEAPNLIRLTVRKLPVPAGILKYKTIEDAWKDKAIVFGTENYRGRDQYLAFKDINMMMQHSYTIGGTGSGKSFWLSFIALQVAMHTGFTFFDVKGDVVDDILKFLPEEARKRVIYLDLQDSMRFIPFNILKQEGMSVLKITEMILNIFIKSFSDGSIKEYSQNMLRNALIAVLSTDPEATLKEVFRMFSDEAYRWERLNAMQREDYEFFSCRDFWENLTMEKGKPKDSKTIFKDASAIINKLMLIDQTERPLYTFSQKDNRLDWSKMMNERKIILVNFSMGQNEDEVLDFFGTVFTSFISKATFGRDLIPRDERVPHIFFLDEFQRFVKNEKDMNKLLELARSYKLGLSLAHQSTAQLKQAATLLNMIKDNTYTQVVLPVGSGSASEVSKMMSTDRTNINENAVQAKELGVFGGHAKFKLLHPEPFTFESLDMNDYFEEASKEAIAEWKQQFKSEVYESMDNIKEDFAERYRKSKENYVEWLQEQDEEDEKQKSAKPKHTGKITGKKSEDKLKETAEKLKGMKKRAN